MKTATLFRAATLGLAWLACSPTIWAQQNLPKPQEQVKTEKKITTEQEELQKTTEKKIVIIDGETNDFNALFPLFPVEKPKPTIGGCSPALPKPNENKEVIVKKDGDVETHIEITTSHDNNTIIEKRVEVRTNGDIKTIGKDIEMQIEEELKNANVKATTIERNHIIIRSENGSDKLTDAKVGADQAKPKTFLGVQTTDLEAGKQGVLVEKVYEHSAAEEAGIRTGDVLTKINGQAIGNSEHLRQTILGLKAGDKVELEFLDKAANNTVRNPSVALKERATRVYAREWSWENNGTWAGKPNSKLENFDPCQKLENLRSQAFLGVYLEAWADKEGAAVQGVIANTSAEKSQLQAKDIIIKLNKKEIKNYQEAMAIIKSHKAGDKVTLQVMRNGKNLKMSVVLGSLGDKDPTYIASLERMCSSKQSLVKQEPCDELEALRTQAFLGVYWDMKYVGKGGTVQSIIANTAAEKANLQAGDIIVKLNKFDVFSYRDATAAIKYLKAGDKATLEILRQGQTLKIPVTLGNWSEQQKSRIQELEKLCTAKPTVSENTQSNTNSLTTNAVMLNLFPNPTTDVLNIRFKGEAAPITISVFNLEGKVILQQEKPDFAGELTHTIQLQNEPAGLYIVSIKQNNKIYTEQFVLAKP